MADVFVSYARSAARFVRPIANALEAEGFDVWWDKELPVHRSYTDVIQEEIAAAKTVVVIWSADAVKSTWVRSEANEGREAGKLVQILVDESALPLPFNQIQFADLRGWRGDRTHPQWRKVVQSLAEIMERPAPGPDIVRASALRRLWTAPTTRWAAAAVVAGLITVVAAAWLVGARPPTRASLPDSAASAKPSFDCAKAESQTERYICAEPAVASAELEMTRAYRAAMARTRDKAALKSGQRDFLINLVAAAHDRETFIGLYKARTATLNTMANSK